MLCGSLDGRGVWTTETQEEEGSDKENRKMSVGMTRKVKQNRKANAGGTGKLTETNAKRSGDSSGGL